VSQRLSWIEILRKSAAIATSLKARVAAKHKEWMISPANN
jgi:hypothetical protein